MTTIIVTRNTNIGSINELIELINKHGSENVTIKSMYNLLSSSNCSAQELYNLLQVLNSESAGVLINNILDDNRLYNKVLENSEFTETQINEHLYDIAVAKKAHIQNVRTSTTIEQLNKLAEANIAPLYYVEVLPVIDLPFIQKYGEQMDLLGVVRNSRNPAVVAFAQNLLNNKE
ncbi:hypothetical protein pEaSNUABM19_00556 [Erwinia phage pEa_SNUABM_19]|nr:hypothetical protein pEaSNUABM19_00556 [Erwinia phage pEa_SNUABM_19]